MWGGWLAALACIVLKVLVVFDPFPYWGTDATRVVGTVTGLTPGWAMLLDCAALAACGAALVGVGIGRQRVSLTMVALWALGAAGAAVHAFILRERALENAAQGLSWAAALGAGLTALHVCRDEGVRRITLACGVGIAGALVAKGALQVLFEHPATLADFRANREAFLAAQGWDAGSPQALSFERRLSQAEATGWFGMANVYASFAAGAWTALLGWSVMALVKVRRGEVPSGWAGVLVLGALAAGAGVWMAGSKGGFAGAALGAALVALAWFGTAARRGRRELWHPAWVGGALALLLIAGTLGAVAGRGLLGEQLGERSLLFRWFYLQGAARIIAEHPLIGVGPAGFKDAYMLAKPPVSPEDVASPHSVMFDYVAALGLLGAAWAALFVWWVWHAGARLLAGAADDEARGSTHGQPHGGSPAPPIPAPLSNPPRPDVWVITALVVVPSLIATAIERPLLTPDGALARVAGLLFWLGLSAAAVLLMRAWPRHHAIAAAAGLILAVHAQFEMTATWPGAAGLCMVLIAGAAAPLGAARGTRLPGVAAGGLLACCGAAGAVLAVVPALRWEAGLRGAAEAAQPAAEVHSRAQVVFGPGRALDREAASQLALDLGRLLGGPAPTNPQEFDAAMNELLVRVSEPAIGRLADAAAAAPSHFQTAEALARLLLARAGAEAAAGRDAGAARSAEEAVRVAERFAGAHPSAAAGGRAGNAPAAAAELLSEPGRLDRAAGAYERGAVLDRYGPPLALKAAAAFAAAARREEARKWAAETLKRDELQRLDPLRRLNAAERRRMEALAAG
ncbi:MAG: O-antigen ligase family protein [Phycisphaerales bacterium]